MHATPQICMVTAGPVRLAGAEGLYSTCDETVAMQDDPGAPLAALDMVENMPRYEEDNVDGLNDAQEGIHAVVPLDAIAAGAMLHQLQHQ